MKGLVSFSVWIIYALSFLQCLLTKSHDNESQKSERGEYVLFLGDSIDRNGIRDYCEYHGAAFGNQYDLIFHNNLSVDSLISFHCENRFGDILAYVHLFNSGYDDEESGAITNSGVDAGSTRERIEKALTIFRNKYSGGRQPDKILLHTSNWDRRYQPYSQPGGIDAMDRSRFELEATFLQPEGVIPFYDNLRAHVRHLKGITSFVTSSGWHSHSRIILRSAPLPALGTVSDPTNCTMAHFNTASKIIAQEEGLEYYDLDTDLWSVADFQCGCRRSYRFHRLLFYDDIHPNRVLSSRFIEKILGLRFSRYYYDFRRGTEGFSCGINLVRAMTVPRWNLCHHNPHHHHHSGQPHLLNSNASETGRTLQDLLMLCPHFEIPIIPINARSMAVDTGIQEYDWNPISQAVKAVLFHARANVSENYLLAISHENLVINGSLHAKSIKKRSLFCEVTEDTMLNGLYGWGDFFYQSLPPIVRDQYLQLNHLYSKHRQSLRPKQMKQLQQQALKIGGGKDDRIFSLAGPVPSYLIFPDSIKLIKILDSSKSTCYLLSESCRMLYKVPTSLCKDSTVANITDRFANYPYLQSRSNFDDAFIQWKFGQGFPYSQGFWDGMIVHIPYIGGYYSYIRGMVRQFETTNTTLMLNYLATHEPRMKKLDEALWMPEMFFIECLPKA